LENLLGLPFSSKQSRLALEREPLTESEFVQGIANEGGDACAAAAIWSHLEAWTDVAGFTPYPTDSFGSVFGLGEEELDEDIILNILRDQHLPPPGRAFLSKFGVVDTPLRAAQLVALCRKPPAGGENPSIREKIVAQLKQMTQAGDGDAPITEDTEIYYDLGVFGHDLRDYLLWVSNEARVPINLNLVEYAPPEEAQPLLFRKWRERRERERRPYKSLTVRDVLELVERERARL